MSTRPVAGPLSATAMMLFFDVVIRLNSVPEVARGTTVEYLPVRCLLVDIIIIKVLKGLR